MHQLCFPSPPEFHYFCNMKEGHCGQIEYSSTFTIPSLIVHAFLQKSFEMFWSETWALHHPHRNWFASSLGLMQSKLLLCRTIGLRKLDGIQFVQKRSSGIEELIM